MKKAIQFITAILIFGLFMTACEKDSTDPVDPGNPDPDPDPPGTELCFDVIDLSTYTQGLKTIDFINENEGWLVGQDPDNMSTSTLLRTADAGLTWTVMNTDLGEYHTHNVSAPFIKFYNATEGYMIGEYDAGLGGNRLKYTTDQGQTWNLISGSAIGTWDVMDVNNNEAVFIGHTVQGYDNGVLYKVSNSSHEITQTLELPSTLDYFAKIDMHVSENGTINVPVSRVNVNSSLYMAHSPDYGASWTYSEIELESIHLVDFPTDNTGYVIGDIGLDGSLYKTTDGGATWTKKTLPMSFIHIDFFDAQNGLGIQEGHIYKTTDGAETWTEVTCFSDSEHSPSRGVAYASLDKWYAIGTRYDADEDKSYKEFYIYEEE